MGLNGSDAMCHGFCCFTHLMGFAIALPTNYLINFAFNFSSIGYLMRLTDFQRQSIYETAKSNFGADAQVWLFGSRVDDQAKGGDIDLYIEPQNQKPADLITAKLQFLRDLHKKIGEQKIDVVLHRADSAVDLPIYRIAKQTGVLLQ